MGAVFSSCCSNRKLGCSGCVKWYSTRSSPGHKSQRLLWGLIQNKTTWLWQQFSLELQQAVCIILLELLYPDNNNVNFLIEAIRVDSLVLNCPGPVLITEPHCTSQRKGSWFLKSYSHSTVPCCVVSSFHGDVSLSRRTLQICIPTMSQTGTGMISLVELVLKQCF